MKRMTLVIEYEEVVGMEGALEEGMRYIERKNPYDFDVVKITELKIEEI